MSGESSHFPQTLVYTFNKKHSLSSQFQKQLEVFTHEYRQAYARPSHIVNRFLNNVWKCQGCNLLSTLTWQNKRRKINSHPNTESVVLQGHCTNWMNNFKCGQQTFGKNRFTSFVKIQGSVFLQIVSQAKISTFLWSSREGRKSSLRQSSAWILYTPLVPTAFHRPYDPHFFLNLTKSSSFLHFLDNPITIKYFQPASDTFQKEVEVLFQCGRTTPL